MYTFTSFVAVVYLLQASFVLSVLAACGWGMYIVGFGIRTTW